MAIVKAFRTLAIAQTIQQSLSGPAGWATLAAGLAIAAGAAYAVNSAFSDQETQLASISTEMKETVSAGTEMVAAQELLAEKTNDTTKQMEKLKQRGAAIYESVRTPVEVAADKIAELNMLIEAGAISGETYGRAMEKVRDELAKATNQAKELKDAGRIDVAAVTRDSAAGFSAVLRAQFGDRKKAELEQKQLEAQRKTNSLLEEANRMASNNKPQTVVKVSM
jgi:hypothetical protein